MCESSGNWSGVTPRCKTVPTPSSTLSSGNLDQTLVLPTPSPSGSIILSQPPSEEASEIFILIIGSGVGMLVAIILFIIAIIVLVYMRHFRFKSDDSLTSAAVDTQRQDCVENPVYTGILIYYYIVIHTLSCDMSNLVYTQLSCSLFSNLIYPSKVWVPQTSIYMSKAAITWCSWIPLYVHFCQISIQGLFVWLYYCINTGQPLHTRTLGRQ